MQVAAWAAVLAAGAFVTACNTVQGIGEDVSALGQGLADTAADAKP